MSQIDIPQPRTIADKLRAIGPGESRYFPRWEASGSSVRSTITRIKTGPETGYTTRPEGDGVRVWRLA